MKKRVVVATVVCLVLAFAGSGYYFFGKNSLKESSITRLNSVEFEPQIFETAGISRGDVKTGSIRFSGELW